MSNPDTPFGFRKIGNLADGSGFGVARPYTVLAADAVAMFVGDGVKTTGTEAIGSDGLVHPVVAQAAATDTMVGTVVGFDLDSNNLNRIYRPASTLRTVYINDDYNDIFIIQVKGTLVADDVGLNADIVVAAGSTITGLSGMELDQTTVTSSTAQLRIMRVLVAPNNETGENCLVEVLINEHRYKTTTGV